MFRGVSTADTITGAQLAHEETRLEPVGSLYFCHIALPPDGLAQDLAGILLAQETQLLSAQLSLHGEYGSAFRLTSPESCRDMLGSWSSAGLGSTALLGSWHSSIYRPGNIQHGSIRRMMSQEPTHPTQGFCQLRKHGSSLYSFSFTLWFHSQQ